MKNSNTTKFREETMKRFMAATLTILLVSTTAFAQAADDHAKAKKGAIIGGIAGAIAGGIISNNRNGHSGKRGAVVGGLAGTAAGAIVGAMMDKQERQLRQIPGVAVTRTSDNELNVTVRNDVLFDYDSASLRSASRAALRDMANVFEQYPNTTIAVQGYTDSTGSASYNERLSERRADSVANYIENLGVRGSRVDTIGFGESRPRATNSTPGGRQLNRRVEIHIRANQA
jgi:outer membrane protein OmpA-like peptidoglycan-associated protein